MIDQRKLDLAIFYAKRMKGEVRELRKNSATISSPCGCEYLAYWQLEEFKRDRLRKPKLPGKGLALIRFARSCMRTKQAAGTLLD